MSEIKRTPVKQKAKQLAKLLKQEFPDYSYLRELFRQLRIELGVEVIRNEIKLPYVPSEEEMRRYYEVVWQSRDMNHVVIIKTLLYTGVRVSELVNIKISEVDLGNCQIKVTQGINSIAIGYQSGISGQGSGWIGIPKSTVVTG